MSRLSVTKTTSFQVPKQEDTFSDQQEYYEYSGNWRNIIFLPYKMIWRIVIVSTIILDCILVTYCLCYDDTARGTLRWFCYYLFETLYLINTVLVILHKSMLPYQKTQIYIPRNSYLIAIDVLTLLPYYETYYVLQLSSKGKGYAFSLDYMKAKVFLRIINIGLFFHNTNNTPGLNHIMITTIMQMVIFCLYNVVVSAVFYTIRSYGHRNWRINLLYHNFNNESRVQWFIITNSVIGNVLAHNWSGLIQPQNVFEDFIFSGTMIFGFLMHVMIFFGQLTALYIKKIADQFHFSSRLYVIANMLDDWNVSRKTKNEAISIYNKFWEKRYGRRNMPDFFYLLPKTLRSDCEIDIFWHFFKHSYFFTDLDFEFLKNLSVHMENEFYMAGEFLYHFDQLKTKMMYIVSGIVELKTQDDQNLISFSSGTVIGEISCLMALKSIVNIRCVTCCEVQTLELKILARQMKKYRGINIQLYRKLNQRFALGRELQLNDLVRLKIRTQKRTSVKWIKQQWRSIYSETKSSKKRSEEKHKRVTIYHTSYYLGLYVLSDEVQLKGKTVCIRSTCPYLFEPSSTFRAFCDYFVLGAIILQSILLPYICFFKKKLTITQIGWFYMLDLVYLFGVYLEMSTVVKSNNRFISKVSQIIIYKGKQISTLVDIFSVIPLECLGFIMAMDARVLAVLRLNRVLRIYKLFKLIQQIQLSVWVSYLKIRLIKYSLLFLYTIYFTTCLIYGITCFDLCDPFGWLSYNAALKLLLSPENITNPPTNFLTSIDYTVSRFLSLTWGNMYAYSIPDIIIEHIITLLGYYMYSFCFAELGACSVLQLEVRSKYLRYLKGLRYFVAQRKIPALLKKCMYNIVQCNWNYNQRYEITGPKSIIRDMPDYLKNQILISRIASCLKTIPFFMECEEDFVWSVAAISKLNVYPPDTVIAREDTFQVQLSVILRGHCLAESSIPTDKYHQCVMSYSYGDCFPIMEMLLGLDSFLKVTSITFVEIITISYTDLMVCIKSRNKFHNDLQKVLKEHLETYNIILTRQKGRLPEMISEIKSHGKGDYFVYDVFDNIKPDPDKINYINTFKKLGQWQFIKHFLLRKTLQPTGKFFITWEIIRCIVALAQVLYAIFFMKFYLKKSKGPHIYLKRTFQVIMVVDFYIRMHTRYYNEKGILVTHPLYTTNHYMKTSFALDLFCVFPFEDLKLNTMLGINYSYHVLLILCTLSRACLLHRAFNGLSYLQEESKEGRAILFQNIKYVALVLLILGILSNILETVTCSAPSTSDSIFYVCPNDSWIKTSIFNTIIEDNTYATSFIGYYVVLSIFATCTVGLFKFQTYKELVVIFILTAGLFGLRWFVLAKITSSRISGNSMLVHYQHNVKIFLKFMKSQYVKNQLIEETISHYEYLWKKTKGYKTTRTLTTFHKVLNADFSFCLYSPALKVTYLLCGADDNDIRFISSYFEEMHFKRDAVIIRCNDIRDMIYIVNKGRVDIFVANDKLCSLTTGGMFGCFLSKGNTRQTITAKAQVNVDILAINNENFDKIISPYPKIKQKIKRERFLKTEYLLPISVLKPKESGETHTEQSPTIIQNIRKIRTFLINPNNTFYLIYDYITNVHLATLSSMIVMTLIVTAEQTDTKKYILYVYLFDIYFISKVFIGFHLTYVDPESGLLQTKYSKIWRRYLKSVNGFWLDIGTCIPIERILALCVDTKNFFNFMLLNRTLRFLFMVKYYTNCKNTLTVSKHLRWTYLMYILFLLLHVNTCVWWLVACPNMKCSYYKRVSHEPLEFLQENNTVVSFRLAYLYVINVFTSTGLKTITPTSTGELITTVIMVCVAQYVLIALTAGFASMLVLDKSVMTNFERRANHVIKYLEATNLSLSLRNKVWNYYVILWMRGHGSWIPQLIRTAPLYLQEDIMLELYGKHLTRHFLFKKTHSDFVRQLVARLELSIFLPGMYITQKGDIDHCMYFIHDGEVIVYDKNGRNEVQQLVLDAGKSFGEVQGLYGVPHDRSYKARFTSKILILKKSRWNYLIKWFPASKEQIEEQVARRFRLQSLTVTC